MVFLFGGGGTLVCTHLSECSWHAHPLSSERLVSNVYMRMNYHTFGESEGNGLIGGEREGEPCRQPACTSVERVPSLPFTGALSLSSAAGTQLICCCRGAVSGDAPPPYTRLLDGTKYQLNY